MEVAVSRAPSPARAVLLVDNSIATRAPLSELLRTNGYQVIEAATSDGALDLLNSRLEVDVLIAQEQVQGSMGGLALAHWMRKTRPAMRLIVVLGQGQTPDAPHEDIAFVRRPFSSADLLAVLPSATLDPVTPGPVTPGP